MTEEQRRIAYDLKRKSHRSYPNILSAARQRRGLPHEPFGTRKVEESALRLVDRIHADANASYRCIGMWALDQSRQR